MATSTKNRTGVGCLMLFALPFAAVGVGVLAWAGYTLVTWQRMSSWEAVPAEILSLDLVAHSDDDGTTYETAATYRYRYDGRDYTGSRVAITSRADNIGDFQKDLYSRLRAAHSRNTPVTAFVDPNNPADATLNRELRWLLLAFQSIFVLVFGGIGFGLLFGARYGGRKLAAEQALQARFPSEPWRWRPEWQDGRIQSSSRAHAYTTTVFAVLWNLVSLPVLLFLPQELAQGNTLALVALVFPLVGVGLAAWAVRSWLRLRRFKVATLVLQRVPVPLGGRLRGAVRIDTHVPVTSTFFVDLSCLEERRSGSGKNQETRERLLWQTQWKVPKNLCQLGVGYTSIPLDVVLPGDQPAANMISGNGAISWRLEVTGECPGRDFWSRFELPVFDVGEQPEAQSANELAATAATMQPTAEQLAALGIHYELLPTGGESWTFRRGQHKTVAATVALFAAIFTGAAALLFHVEAPLALPIAFAAFGLLFVWWLLSLCFTEYRVALEAGLLTLTRRGFMARAPIEVPRQWVQRVRAVRSMQAGNKLYYDLRVETNQGTHTAASSLGDHAVATWLANYWMTDGKQLA